MYCLLSSLSAVHCLIAGYSRRQIYADEAQAFHNVDVGYLQARVDLLSNTRQALSVPLTASLRGMAIRSRHIDEGAYYCGARQPFR